MDTEQKTPTQFIVIKTVQFAIAAENHDDALEGVLNGEGEVMSTSYQANFRSAPAMIVQSPKGGQAQPAKLGKAKQKT